MDTKLKTISDCNYTEIKEDIRQWQWQRIKWNEVNDLYIAVCTVSLYNGIWLNQVIEINCYNYFMNVWTIGLSFDQIRYMLYQSVFAADCYFR